MSTNPNKKQARTWSGIVLLLVVGMLISVYITRASKQQNLENQSIDLNVAVAANANSNQPAPSIVKEYENTDYQFRLKYPKTYKITTAKSGASPEEIFSVIIESKSDSMSVSVMPVSLEGIITNSIGVTSKIGITVDGVSAEKLTGGDAKDGSPVDLIIVKNNNRLYSLKGYGQDFEGIVKNFKFI